MLLTTSYIFFNQFYALRLLLCFMFTFMFSFMLTSTLNFMISFGKKGMYIQRYKGLGEMNPEQLWETTLDPDVRTLKKVNIEDLVESDGIFTILMGDQVEPRRNFIEENALRVKNLDV